MKAFGEMTEEEKIEVATAIITGQTVLYKNDECGLPRIHPLMGKGEGLCIYGSVYYEVPEKKLNIPWDFINPMYRYAYISHGAVYLSKDFPKRNVSDTAYESTDIVNPCITIWYNVDIEGILPHNHVSERPDVDD